MLTQVVDSEVNIQRQNTPQHWWKAVVEYARELQVWRIWDCCLLWLVWRTSSLIVTAHGLL